MAQYDFVSPGAMATDALRQVLQRREEERAQRVLEELRAKQLEAQNRRIDLDERGLNLEQRNADYDISRQSRVDAQAQADRELAARGAENERGMRTMMADALTQAPVPEGGGVDPETLRNLGILAVREGVDLPLDVMDPDRAQRAEIAGDERQHQYRMEEIDAGQRDPQWQSAGPGVIFNPVTSEFKQVPGTGAGAGAGVGMSTEDLYSSVRSSRAVESVDELLDDTSWATVGPVGAVAGVVPGTPAYDYASKLISLGAQLSTNELAQMRAASKTGGAVGQVSNVEQEMFQNALAPIKQGQSISAMRAGLQRARESLQRYQLAVRLQAGGASRDEIMGAVYGADGPPAQSGGGGTSGLRVLSIEEAGGQ